MSSRLPTRYLISPKQTTSASFVCPSCRFRSGPLVLDNGKAPWRFQYRQKRHASSISPVTTINASKQIPARYQELHDRLSVLGSKATTYVDLSKLRLALNSLESENAVIRIAVIGLENNGSAHKLVQALLADPLSPESPWERQLANGRHGGGQGLLIRYGEDYQYDERHPILHVLSIPSSMLNRLNVEILISSPLDGSNSMVSKGDSVDLLVPTLETPVPASGRATMVTYPVHKAVIYGEGISGLLACSKWINRADSERDTAAILGVVNVHWQIEEQESGLNIAFANLDQAESAIAQIRKAIENSTDYEHKWLDSNMSAISSWITGGAKASDSGVKPVIKHLIEIILKGVERQTLTEESYRLQQLGIEAVPDSVRHDLEETITSWAENAHTELRDCLHNAFHGKNWGRLAWWKLFWRVDDVGMFSSEILQCSWLVEAEKEVIWIAGRIQQAGLINSNQRNPGPVTEGKSIESDIIFGKDPPAPRFVDLIDQPATTSEYIFFNPLNPCPQQITLARQSLSAITVPPLQALSQRLLLRTVSTTTATTALSCLLYFSLSTTSIYEAGAIAAFGLVYSLRTLQQRWEGAKGVWMGAVGEEARRVLKTLEDTLREVVRQGGKQKMDDAEVEERKLAGEAVEAVREALEKVGRIEKES